MPLARRETGFIDEILGSFSNIGFLDAVKEGIVTMIHIGIDVLKELGTLFGEMARGIMGR